MKSCRKSRKILEEQSQYIIGFHILGDLTVYLNGDNSFIYQQRFDKYKLKIPQVTLIAFLFEL